jgi:hypothetical protein
MAKKRFKPMTAQEYLEQRQQDPEWVARRKEDDRRRQIRIDQLTFEERPLVKDLARAGCIVKSAADLINTREPYPEALPILLKHLKNTNYSTEIREGIARALTVRHPIVKEALPQLVEAFRKDPDPRLNRSKWAIGNAIEVLYDDRYADQIIDLVLDRSHGPARTMLIWALRKSKSDRAPETLEALVDDPVVEVAGIAERALESWQRRSARRAESKRARGRV